MGRFFSFVLIFAGLIIIGFSGYQIYQNMKNQEVSLDKARDKVDKPPISKEDFVVFTDEVIGILKIPSIDAELPIVEGTDEDDLAKGVGHYKGTAWPLENDQIVLSGHRDTVFRRMGEVKIGDEFIVKLPYGEFRYKIVETKIVDRDDRTVIKSTAPNEILTVTTCHPFRYVGNAPNRYILNAVPVR